MTDLDLIPSDYRIRRWQTRWLKVSGAAVVGLTIAQLAVFASLQAKEAKLRTQIDALTNRQQVTNQQQTELNTLTDKATEYLRQLDQLNGLRAGGKAEDMLQTIERSLSSSDVWLTDWSFRRAGSATDREEVTVDTGYFVVVPAGTEAPESTLQVTTQMSIRGQSKDHAALSGFVRALFSQPEIEDVQVGRTTRERGAAIEVVSFDLAVVMNAAVSPP